MMAPVLIVGLRNLLGLWLVIVVWHLSRQISLLLLAWKRCVKSFCPMLVKVYASSVVIGNKKSVLYILSMFWSLVITFADTVTLFTYSRSVLTDLCYVFMVLTQIKTSWYSRGVLQDVDICQEFNWQQKLICSSVLFNRTISNWISIHCFTFSGLWRDYFVLLKSLHDILARLNHGIGQGNPILSFNFH